MRGFAILRSGFFAKSLSNSETITEEHSLLNSRANWFVDDTYIFDPS